MALPAVLSEAARRPETVDRPLPPDAPNTGTSTRDWPGNVTAGWNFVANAPPHCNCNHCDGHTM
ncbi:hypothetical protein Srubr_25550 [Streptomyces rubradiris]|uniref:Uncharacterized protein n=1 Tax=Streptomyces rubradiris TaxID=285531 RepID=A0ABQ3RA29_STRRR|nr:hypothetical protein Srubr_25550 [Streptomyces rubradiris]